VSQPDKHILNCDSSPAIDTGQDHYYPVFVTRDLVPCRVRTVKETADVSLTRFDHPTGVSLPDSEERAADRFQINIVERGAFRLGTSRPRVAARQRLRLSQPPR